MKRFAKRFIKENLALTIGISLPILLVIIFATGAFLPKRLVPSPKYDFLYMTLPYPHDGVSTELVEGKLKISITSEVKKGTLPMPRLFRFNAKTRTSKEIPLELAADSKNIENIPSQKKKEELEIPQIKDLKLDPKDISPDGYKAELALPNYNNALNFLVSNSYKRSLVISKSGKIITIADETNNIYGDKSIKFLGWIIPE